MQQGVEPHAFLSGVYWEDISPIMDVQYRVYERAKSGGAGDAIANETPSRGKYTEIKLDSKGVIYEVDERGE